MLPEYEDGYIPEPHTVNLYRLKTPELLKFLIGKVVKDIKYYSCMVLIIFEDETELEIDADDCFDFHVEINGVVIND